MLPKKMACYDLSLMDSFCKIHPIRLIKTTRLRVSLAENLLNDENLPNFKMIVLFRDPRATMNSRASALFCNRTEECYDLEVLCHNLQSDLHAAFDLAEKYPGRILLIRFEDMTLQPYRAAKDILRFLRLPWHSHIRSFLNSHLQPQLIKIEENFFNTYRRNSREVAFAWRDKLDFEQVREIQNVCQASMDILGYHPFQTKLEITDKDVKVLVTERQNVWPFFDWQV